MPFFDPHRIIVEDISHGTAEDRFIVMADRRGIMSVRFTYRGMLSVFMVPDTGKGEKKFYEEQNKI